MYSCFKNWPRVEQGTIRWTALAMGFAHSQGFGPRASPWGREGLCCLIRYILCVKKTRMLFLLATLTTWQRCATPARLWT